MKWNAEKYKDNCDELSNKYKSLSAEMLELNRRIMEL